MKFDIVHKYKYTSRRLNFFNPVNSSNFHSIG